MPKCKQAVHARDLLIPRNYTIIREDKKVRGFFKHATAPELAKSLGPFVACIIVGITLKYLWHPLGFMASLGDPIMIAGIVGLSIEWWAASVLIDRTSKAVSDKLIGAGLPKPAQLIIGSLVHDTKIVLREYRAVFRMERHSEKPDYLTIHVTVTFKVLNNGLREEKYRPVLIEELIYNPRLEILEYGGYSFTALPPKQPETVQRAWEPSDVFRLKPSEAAADADSLDCEQVCHVRLAYSVEMPDRYSSTLHFGRIVINPEVQFDPLPPGVSLKLYAMPDDSCQHVDGSLKWRYERAFISGQSIRLWWEPQQTIR
jgi:hypothetical protein